MNRSLGHLWDDVGTFGMMWAPFLAWVLDPFLLLSSELGKAKGRNLCCFPVVE